MSTREPFFLHIVRSDGQTLDVGDGTEWVLSMNDMSDWVPLDYGVETSANVLTDGSTLVSKRVNEKDRTIRCVYWGRDRKGVRDRVISFFNPKYSFEAHLTYMGRTRWCEGEQIGFEMGITDERTPPSFTWTLLCLDPYMRSEDGNQNSMTDAAPMFGFPYVSHMRTPLPDGSKKPVGSLASKMLYDGLNTVYNSGDVPCYYTIRMEAKGEVQSPTFTKDDRFIKVLDRFVAGDVLEIDFTKAPPTVTKNGVNIIGKCSRDSNFTGMAMQVGGNVFQYTCDNSANRPYMDVQILFHKRYLGV